MTIRDDGGPAFPGQYDHGGGQIESWVGMSLRDYFAVHERSEPPLSWWKSRVGDYVNNPLELSGVVRAEGLAAWRFQVADAMLKERAK